MESESIKKLYYSISEVSQITGVKKHILRTWEMEFPELHPSKNRAGNRTYRLSDIKTIYQIKRLLYHEKYTLEGARQKLLELRKSSDKESMSTLDDLKVADVLSEVKHEIREMLTILRNESADTEHSPSAE